MECCSWPMVMFTLPHRLPTWMFMPPPLLVLFDMDDVLCAYSRPARAAHLAHLAGTTTEAVQGAIWGSGFEAVGDAGTLDASAYLSGFGERIGYPLTTKEWVDARRAGMSPRLEVLEIVRQVRQRARVAVLTNNTTLVANHIEELFPELPPLFGQDVYASASFHAAKPAEECYRRCLSALGTSPTDTLFVDDLLENVAGAEAMGICAHHYTSPQALARLLRERGLL